MHRAKMTVDLLEEEFARRQANLRAITSKGTVMDTISFRSESTDEKVRTPSRGQYLRMPVQPIFSTFPYISENYSPIFSLKMKIRLFSAKMLGNTPIFPQFPMKISIQISLTF